MSRSTSPALGEQELALLQHVARQGPVSVGEVAETYGASAALARSTVLTMMERLRQKGYLVRRRAGGVFRYSSPRSAREVLRGVVQRFVERSLEGSVTPVVQYLVERREVTDAELGELEALVARLRSEREEH